MSASSDPGEQLLTVARTLAAFFDRPLTLDAEDLAPLDPDGRLDLVTARLRRARLPRDLVGSDQARSLLRVYAYLQREAVLYRSVPVSIPIQLFVSEHNDAAALAAGWQGYGGLLRVHHAKGDHIGMLKPPAVAGLAETLAGLMGTSGKFELRK
jgi:thioesterase domain-containing protein